MASDSQTLKSETPSPTGDASGQFISSSCPLSAPTNDAARNVPSTSQEDASKDLRSERRVICDRCRRPALRACICPSLPDQPVELADDLVVVILQHPKEFQHKTSRSVPLLEFCLAASHLHLCVGRRLGDQIPPAVHDLLQDPDHLVLLIFPETPDDGLSVASQASTITHETNTTNSKSATSMMMSVRQAKELISERRRRQETPSMFTTPQQSDSQTANTDGATVSLSIEKGRGKKKKNILLVLDATWKYAKEMHRANLLGGHYPSHLRRMAIAPDDLPTDYRARRFDIRTTPTPTAPATNDTDTANSSSSLLSWMCTAECVAWILSQLEERADIYETILKPLDYMVHQWKHCIQENKHKKGKNKKRQKSQGSNPDEEDSVGRQQQAKQSK